MAKLLRRAIDHSDFATVPLAIAECVAILARHSDGFGTIVGFVVGFVAWTLVEYAVHRALHDKRFPRLRALHMAHHQHPTGASGGTLYSSLIIVAVLAGAIVAPGAAAFILGVLTGYLAFIALHHAEHHAEVALAASPIRWIADHHYRHHHARPRGCFGVTTTMWDYLFGTL